MKKIQQANEEAVTRIIQSKPILVGFDKAINVMPDMTEKDHFTCWATHYL